VLVNEERSDFRKERFGMRHGFLPLGRAKGGMQRVYALEPELDDSIDG
jgi:hypothetical protein